jgi:hypothetical protein
MVAFNEFADDRPWVDVFTGSNFSGQIHRFHGRSSGRSVVYPRKKLPKICSIIVGPGAVAQFERGGGSQLIRLQSRTILPDTSRFTSGHPILSLMVAPA